MASGSGSNYGIVISQNVMVPMRDGVRLATDIYRPADTNGIPLPGQFPVILGRTSYDKSNPVIWIKPVAEAFVPRTFGDAVFPKVQAIIFTRPTRRKAWMGTTRSSGPQTRHGATGKSAW